MNVLILGAGLMQKPAILSAKELGYKTVVIDADDKAVCIPYADAFRRIDLKDREGILAFARELQADGGLAGIFTAGTDFSASVSYAGEKLALAVHPFEAALNASVKDRMRACFAAHGVPSPQFCPVQKTELSSPEDLLQKITGTLEFPIVVKPVDNMGARGCRLVRSQKELLPALEAAVSNSRTQTAIAEEFMDGPEYSIDALVYDSTFTVTGFAERHICYPPYFIEIGHTMPAVLDQKIRDELVSVFALGAKALGLTCGAAKADIKYTKKGAMIGEIAGRLSGGYMSGWTYPYSSDLNLTKQALLLACGQRPESLEAHRIPVSFAPGFAAERPYELYEVPSVRTSAERAWISIPGTVKYIENINEFTDKAVFDVLPRAMVMPGASVDFPRNNVQKCGNVISVSNARDVAVAAAENAVSDVFITLEPKNAATERFLSCAELSDERQFPPDAFGRLSEQELTAVTGILAENAPAKENIPELLKSSEYKDRRDWNFNTIAQTAEKFDRLRPTHPALDARTFWNAVLRGGLQAAVYISDSTECL